MTVCPICYPFEKLDHTFSEVVVKGYDIVGPYLAHLMGSIAGVVMVYGFIMALFRPGNVIMEMYTRNLIMWISMSTLLMFSPAWFTFLSAFADLGPYLGTKIISQYLSGTIERGELTGLLEAIETGFVDKIGVAYFHWAREVSIMSTFVMWAGTILLGAVYLIVSYKLLAGILRGYFKIVAVNIIAPFVVFFAGFDQTRSISIASMRVLLAATLELFVSCVVTAAMLFLFTQMQGEYDFATASDYLTASDRFLGVLMTGVLMILVHSVFTEVIGQITLTFGTAAKASLGSIVSKIAGLG